MKRTEYLAVLATLPIVEPTFEQLQAVVPHLNEKEVRAVLRLRGRKDKSVYLAAPPVKVRSGYHALCISIDRKGVRTLRHAFARRTIHSYASGIPQGDIFNQMCFQRRAMDFAENNWGSELILDTWKSYGEILLQDPSQLRSDVYPTTVKVIGWTTNRSWYDLSNDHDKRSTASQKWDKALVEISTNEFEQDELKGGRGGYTDYICALCGEGMGLSSCPGCGHTFRDDMFRSGGGPAIPAKIVKLLAKEGHQMTLGKYASSSKPVLA